MTIQTNIALTHNDAYTEHSVVCMTSVMINKTEDENINFFILDGGLSDQSKEKINEVKAFGNCEIEFIEIDKARFEGYKKSDYYPVQILYTMILPDVIEVDRLIYLDCDLVVNKSLNELMELDLKDNYIGAVEDANGKKYARRYGLKTPLFFNTGLMVLNCEKWRKDDIAKRATQIAIEKTGTSFGYDQTVLNQLFENYVHYLPLKWNLQYCPINVWPSYDDICEYKTAIKYPYIIHYVGDYKPWVLGLGCFNPKQSDYFKYHIKTSYAKENLPAWLKLDKLNSCKGIWAFIKRYPFFFLKKKFWTNIFN